MKRSGPPARRTPLKAKQGMPRARAAMQSRSTKRAEARDAERHVTLAMQARDGGRCLLENSATWGPCAGRITPHHLRKQGQGGPWTLDNLVSLCAHHNDEVENRPTEAHRLGLVVRAGETTTEAWERMGAAGLVDDDRWYGGLDLTIECERPTCGHLQGQHEFGAFLLARCCEDGCDCSDFR